MDARQRSEAKLKSEIGEQPSRLKSRSLLWPSEDCGAPQAIIPSSSSSAAMAFTCPIDESNDKSGGKDLQCHLCQSRLHSYRSLIEHFNRRHGVARSLMSKMYVYKQAAAARRVLRNVTLSRDEFNSVAPHVAATEPSRTCICLMCNMVLNKRRVAKHFEEVHGCDISWGGGEGMGEEGRCEEGGGE